MNACDLKQNCFFKDLSPKDAEEEMEKIAARGARAALKEIGLADENAGNDVQSLREMLKDWRALKKESLKTVCRWLGVIALGYLSLKLGWVEFLKIGKP